mmetsp:Transcript_20097/g.25380  ORF Transcript_20097/g.25380 Transcript_20097/m.25380 type:complete len:114 (-) Transcript_20097:649-990(-)|eukprot:CAMPEP_0203643036 /NCGR_PEP_ID=MMETSP0088-20131115/8465_1 /ASSEMBLY_ACC=CAM_ASM_001087 /TAXON_ID=426623 /ORGANISM="Chaetoceros affinis, Strain CCMP159" /LENGTH=113 /DNA_ID=CAMNT_0050499081 /DNA_START=245 /DNA_END=586 /DNA_ORIENTATION=+
MTQPSKPTFIEAEETVIIVEFTPDTNGNAESYKLSWKQHPQPWSEAESKLIHPSSQQKIRVEAADLIPSTTYCLRLVMVDGNGNEVGDYSPELIVDTEAVGCTPQQKSCCVVQ